jgi:hypothetical protein
LNLHDSFKIGARKLAGANREYTALHKAHGIEENHWQLITQPEYWTADEARAVRSILANVVEVAMTIAGMPAIPLPAQYVAAVIAEVVAPCNRMLASMKAPDTFDAFDASGLLGTTEVKPATKEQMMALVLAYSGQWSGEPHQRVPAEVVEQVKKANTSNRKKELN